VGRLLAGAGVRIEPGSAAANTAGAPKHRSRPRGWEDGFPAALRARSDGSLECRDLDREPGVAFERRGGRRMMVFVVDGQSVMRLIATNIVVVPSEGTGCAEGTQRVRACGGLT
jgi:hypothetical protein